MSRGPGKWTPAEATNRINAYAKDPTFDLSPAKHVSERLLLRDLMMADLRYLLRWGFVYDEPQSASRQGYYKYKIEGGTPNSANQVLAAIVIPGPPCAIKVVTIMWRDE